MQTKIHLRPSAPSQNGQQKAPSHYSGRNFDRNFGHVHADICPHLRSFSDDGTAIAFPAKANCCYHVLPVTPVKRRHQQTYCLNHRYRACPIYRSRAKVRLPQARQRQPDILYSGLLVASLLTFIIILFLLVI